jgi:hypothetical protein
MNEQLNVIHSLRGINSVIVCRSSGNDISIPYSIVNGILCIIRSSLK